MKWQICPIQDFERHADAWDGLNDALQASPLLTSHFLRAALRGFGTGRELLAILWDDGTPIAMTVLNRRKYGVWETFQPSQAPIGFWLSTPASDPVADAQRLMKFLPGMVFLLGITQQDPEIIPRPEEAECSRTLDYIQTPRILIQQDFETYWSGLGKNMRQNVRKATNRLERAGLVPQLDRITDPARVRDAIETYGRLESSGWKSQEGTAVHINNQQGGFYLELLQSHAERGHALIYEYRFNDQVVAMDICIHYRKVLVILKTAYDESAAEFSPALLMHYGIFQDIFTAGNIERIEFYGKFMEWHRRWTEDTRTMFHLNCYRWPWIKRALG